MGNETGLFGLSCPGPKSCLAVGDALAYTHGELGADFPAGVAESWDGSAWRAAAVPRGPDQGPLALNGDSCLSPSNCWAVAGFPSIVGYDHPVPLLHWDGSTFSTVTLSETGFMDGIGCLKVTSGTWCITLGESVNKAGRASLAGGYFRVP